MHFNITKLGFFDLVLNEINGMEIFCEVTIHCPVTNVCNSDNFHVTNDELIQHHMELSAKQPINKSGVNFTDYNILDMN